MASKSKRPDPPISPKLPEPRRILVPALFFLLGFFNLFQPWFHGGLLGDIGDGMWNNVPLEHQYRLYFDKGYPGSHGAAPFWHPDSRDNMANSDMLLGVAPFYMAPRLIVDRELAYQLFYLIISALNFIAFFWFLRELGCHYWAASAGAALFAFGAHRWTHTIHTQLLAGFWGVAALLFLLRFLKAPSLRYLALLVAGFALQGLTSPYSGYFFALGGVTLVLMHAVVDWPRTRVALVWCRREAFAIIGVVTVVAVPVAFLLLPYIRAHAGGKGREWWEVIMFAPQPWFWIYPLRDTLWNVLWRPIWPGLESIASDSQFLGVAACGLALAAGVLAIRRPWRREEGGRVAAIFLGSAVLLMLLTLRWGEDKTLWVYVYDHVPGASGLRDIRRVSLVVNVFLIGGAMLLLSRLLARLSARNGLILFLSVAALMLAENRIAAQPGAYRESSWYAEELRHLRSLMSKARSAYIYNDPELPPYSTEIVAQHLAMELHVPVVNGFSGRYPAWFHHRLSPIEVVRHGTRLDFDGFVYIVPGRGLPDLKDELERAGLRPIGREGKFYAFAALHADLRDGLESRIAGGVPATARAGAEGEVAAVITNRSNFPWQSAGNWPVFASCQLFDSPPPAATNSTPLAYCQRTALPEVLLPGESAFVRLRFPAPERPGRYLVRTGVVHERRAWVVSPADDPGSFTVEVQP